MCGATHVQRPDATHPSLIPWKEERVPGRQHHVPAVQRGGELLPVPCSLAACIKLRTGPGKHVRLSARPANVTDQSMSCQRSSCCAFMA